MKNKKGFTLVELLAVISILAVLAIIVIPRVVDLFGNAKQSAFLTEVKSVYTAAEDAYVQDSFSEGGSKKYSHCSNGTCNEKLKLLGNAKIDYYIEIDSTGNIVKYYATDGTYQYSYTGSGLKKPDIKKASFVPDLPIDDRIVINGGGYDYEEEELPPVVAKECNYEGELVQGTEFVEGDFIYRYKQENRWVFEGGWENIEEDGWGVVYKPSYEAAWFGGETTTPTSETKSSMCTTIAGKPIVSMFSTFAYTNLDNIDFSSIDTSHVTNMDSTFDGAYSTSPVELRRLDTSNVTDMYRMFANSNIKDLNVKSLDTSKATTISGMFENIKNNNIDVSRFDLSNVESMFGVFENTNLDTLDLSNWDVSNVKYNGYLFSGAKINTLIMGDWNSKNAEDFSQMFARSEIGNLSLNYIDCSNAKNMYMMYDGVNLDNLNLNIFRNLNKLEKTYSMFEFANIGNLVIDGIDLSTVTNAKYMFSRSNIGNLRLANISFDSATDLTSMFSNATIGNLTLENVDTSNVTSMVSMFSQFTTNSLDLSELDTANVTNMNYMFYFSNINDLNLSNFNTLNVNKMQWMFDGANIPTLDLSSFSLNNSVSLAYMFKECKATSGFAQDGSSASRFNNKNTTRIPDTLVFVVPR